MQAEGGRPFGLSLAAALLGSLGANALATLAIPTGGWWLAGGIGLNVIQNSGISFGLGSSFSAVAVVTLSSAALAAAWYALRKSAGVGLGLLLGGGVANLLDRLADGLVTDYFAVGPWPTFNIADTFITAGAITLALHFLSHRSGSA